MNATMPYWARNLILYKLYAKTTATANDRCNSPLSQRAFFGLDQQTDVLKTQDR